MENNAEKIFTDLKEDIATCTGLKFRLLKLMAIEKAAGVLSVFSHSLILLLFAFFTILFLFIALGFYLGDLLGSIAWGFLIIGGIYLVLTVVFTWARGGIRMQFMNIFINAMQTNNEEDDNNGEDQAAVSTRTTVTGKAGNPATMPGVGKQD